MNMPRERKIWAADISLEAKDQLIAGLSTEERNVNSSPIVSLLKGALTVIWERMDNMSALNSKRNKRLNNSLMFH